MADESAQAFYEMLWDCSYCGQKGLLAKSQRFCPECGGAQNPDKRYFPAEGSEKKVEGHVYEGADHACPACNAPMGAKAKNCTQCGAPMDGSKDVRGVEDKAAAPAPPKPAPAKKGGAKWPYVLVGIGLVVFLIWFFFIRAHAATLTVKEHRWKREIAVEEFGPHTKQGWRNEVPADATNLACYPKQRSTKKVEDGQDCHMVRVDKKDGTFTQEQKCEPKYRDQPVNDDYCNYTQTSWEKVTAFTATGTGISPGPSWPAVTALPQNRRQGPQSENLTLDFGTAGTCDNVPDALWRKYADGKKYKLEVRASSGDVVCDSLQ